MKSLDALKKQLESYHWYKQAGAAKPLYISYPYLACLGFAMNGRRVVYDYRPMIGYFRHDYLEVLFAREQMDKIARYYMHREATYTGWFVKRYTRWQEHNTRSLASTIHRIMETDLTALTHAAFVNVFKTFSHCYDAWWREAIFIDAFDVVGDTLLEEDRRREMPAMSNNDIDILTAAEAYSWLQREQAALLALCKRASKEKSLRLMLISPDIDHTKLELRFPKFVAFLKRHAIAYGWMTNDYAVVRQRTWRDVASRVSVLIRNKKELQTIEKNLRAVALVKKNKDIIWKKYPLSSLLKKKVKSFVLLARWRDHRKAYNQMATGIVYRFAKEYARRMHMPMREVEYSCWWELLEHFPIKASLARHCRERYKGVGVINNIQNAKQFLYGRDGSRLHTMMNAIMKSSVVLKGRPAFPGLVRSVARIIRGQHEFNKMRKGDILIASNTRPEYVPIMKLASAIVSEEGGLTCHTAIVARELKIPAIVGVQGIIGSLKDGDRIEVNATNGTIKKLS